MEQHRTAEYGFWKSPITSDLIAAETIRLGGVQLSEGNVYWLESRPAEKGRSAIVRRGADGGTVDLLAPPHSARTRVHEYGGGAYLADGETVYFSHDKDQRLYRTQAGDEPIALTPEAAWRYADFAIDPVRGRLICVREDHSNAGAEAVNTIVALDLSGDRGQSVLVSGRDFYSNPRLSPDGRRLAWLSWNHPNMPWDGTELWVADFDDGGAITSPQRVAGGPSESVFQPEWSPDGTLYFVSDPKGWWNLYRLMEGEVEPVVEIEAEFGLPQWIFGRSTYAVESADRIIGAYNRKGRWTLAAIVTGTRKAEDIETPYTEIEDVCAEPGRVVFHGGSPSEPGSIVEMNLDTGETAVLRREMNAEPEYQRYFSIPEAIEFPTGHGQTAHAFHYAPKNPLFSAPPGEKPPLIVISHGGPTGATSSTLSLRTQFWTSRGFAVLDVNYGGSTGYGRAYRERLNGQWGIVDVNDCVNGAKYLAEQGDVDGERLLIRGGSAGGYTTLAVLTFRDVFKAGASYYGVSDVELLAKETHKFESRYMDTMIGPYPESRDVYLERSPIQHADRLSAPVIFFQGSEDKVVPPNQAELMLEALRKKGVPACYLLFEGERHGFRQASTIKRTLDAELYFYATMVLNKGLRF